MTRWRQAVFLRQRRIDLIQRALAKVLDEEAWSLATPRRLHIGVADASSHGWTMIAPALANFFVDRGAGAPAPRLCRLARELRCPAYMIDVRHAAATLIESDPSGRIQVSGSPASARLCGLVSAGGEPGHGVASTTVRFGLLPTPDDVRERISALHGAPASAIADYLGALAGFPAWTQQGDDLLADGELVYEPPRVVGPHAAARAPEPATAGIRARSPETREASARTTPRVAPPVRDRRGRRPRSAARPRR